MTATPELRVELIRWPAEQARREACLERGVIRLLVVEGAAWCQVVEATSRRSYASRGVSHPKAALGRPPKFFGDGVEVGLVCGDLGSFG